MLVKLNANMDGISRVWLKVSWENQRTKWGIFHQAMFDYQRVTMLTIPKMWFISGQCAPLAQGRGCTSFTKQIGLFQGGELD
jgi:hypothetical protein